MANHDPSGGPDGGPLSGHAHDAIGIAIATGLGFVALPTEWSWPVRIFAGLLAAVVLVSVFSRYPAVPARILELFGNPRFALPVIGVLLVALAWVAISPVIGPSIPAAVREELWLAVIPGGAVVLYLGASRVPEFTRGTVWRILLSAVAVGVYVAGINFLWLESAMLSRGEYPRFPIGAFSLWASVAAIGLVAIWRALVNLVSMIPGVPQLFGRLPPERDRF